MGKKSTEVDTDGMEDLYQQALDWAKQQDAWNREQQQSQMEWGAEDRARLLENSAIDRSMYYQMLGQDRGFAEDAFNYNRNQADLTTGMVMDAYGFNRGQAEATSAMMADAYGFNRGQAEQAMAMAQQAMGYNMGANEQDRAMFAANMAAHQASVDAANAQQAAEWAWNRGNIEADRAYYDANYKPLEQRLIADSSPTALQYQQAAAAAAADVANAYDKQMGIQRREAARYGIDPMSGRYASANRAFDLSRAAAEAGAMGNARSSTKAAADANRAAALQVGQQHRNTQLLNPGNYDAYTMASFKSSPLAYYNPQQVTPYNMPTVNAGNLPTISYNAPLSTPNSYGGFGLPGSFNSQAPGVAQNFGNTLGNMATAEANANAQNNAGLFGAIGTGIGLGFKFLSSRSTKTDIRGLDGRKAMEALGQVRAVSFAYKQGMGPVGERWGAIAEEVPAVFATPERDALDAYNLVGALVAAVQHLSARLRKLEISKE